MMEADAEAPAITPPSTGNAGLGRDFRLKLDALGHRRRAGIRYGSGRQGYTLVLPPLVTRPSPGLTGER